MPARAARIVVLLLLAAAPVLAGSREVRMGLRVAPQLKLTGGERLYIGPLLLEPGDEGTRRVDVSAVREFDRFVRRLLRRQTRLTLLPPDDALAPPTADVNALRGMTGFWRDLAERSGADMVVSASIDVQVLDRTGYTTEKYVSPEDGKTYFRQVLVEETGFKYDILLLVFDPSGALVLEEQISDFQERQPRKLDEFTDMFEELYTLENRLLGVFVPRVVRARRYLYS
jgi:hypothetical protein